MTFIDYIMYALISITLICSICTIIALCGSVSCSRATTKLLALDPDDPDLDAKVEAIIQSRSGFLRWIEVKLKMGKV